MSDISPIDAALEEWLASCTKDPVAFVLGAFPWGEAGSVLETEEIDAWQMQILCWVRDGIITLENAVLLAVASGHGVGKSALVAWLILWAFATLPDTRGWVTANTENQLKTKTWAELGKWFNLFIAREKFTLTATALLSKDPSRERTWRIDMTPWSEKNTEAFAGMHNKGKRILLIMDEGSAIPDMIWEVAEGALTDADTEIIWIAFGNPTRNSGRFKECFAGGKHSRNWKTLKVDSRTVKITNKTQINKWIDVYGDDSDFVRIRVKGEFPRQGLMEFFSAAAIQAAMEREATSQLTDPLALGIDVARYGANNSVIFPRKGRDARSLARQVFHGLSTVALAEKVYDAQRLWHADGLFIDGGGVGGGVVDNVRHKQLFCYEVQFGGKVDTNGADWGVQGEKYYNKRASMYGYLRGWLETGALPLDEELRKQMLCIKYTFDKNDSIQLVAKEDLEDEVGNKISVDDIDALVLTFAYPLASHAFAGGDHPQRATNTSEHEYDPYSEERMSA